MGKTLIEGVGNYLIVSCSHLGNCVIVNTVTTNHVSTENCTEIQIDAPT